MKKNIISLHGSYFGNNYGDVLLVSIFAKWIKHCYPNCIINLPLANKSKTKNLPDGVVGIMNLLRSKCLVFCGGGYFGEQPKHKNRWAFRNFFRHGIIGVLAILFKIPYAIIGVEFGPISNKWFRKICVMIAKHSCVVVVRNAESKIFLESYSVKNVIQSVDAVLCLSDFVSPLLPLTNDIVLHIPGIENAPQQYTELIRSLIRYIKEGGGISRVLFVSDSFSDIYHTSSYSFVIKLLEQNSIQYSIVPYTGFMGLIDLINNNRFIITTKLHVGITAAALNKRPLSFWQHPKTKRLHEQIGNAVFCYPINETNNFFDIIKDYITQDTSQYMLPEKIKKQALINREELFLFLNSVLK